MKSIQTAAISLLSGLIASTGYAAAPAAGPSRQNEVATRGAQVMPFKLKATTHIFSKLVDGGIQQVVVKDPGDDSQLRLVREHLRQITDQFRKGDFSGPERIHGMSMPGLAELKKAKPGDIQIKYHNIPSGGQAHYSMSNKALVAALHDWFDAQLLDHGTDATEGHDPKHVKMHHE
jgi:hypothetical protein